MEPARIAKDRSRLLFFSITAFFHFSLPHLQAREKSFFSNFKRVRITFPHHQTNVARIGSSVTLADWVKRHACEPGQASRFIIHLPQYQLQTREQSFSAPSNKCSADRVKRHACNGKNGWPCTVSRLIHFQNKLYLGLTSKNWLKILEKTHLVHGIVLPYLEWCRFKIKYYMGPSPVS